MPWEHYDNLNLICLYFHQSEPCCFCWDNIYYNVCCILWNRQTMKWYWTSSSSQNAQSNCIIFKIWPQPQTVEIRGSASLHVMGICVSFRIHMLKVEDLMSFVVRSKSLETSTSQTWWNRHTSRDKMKTPPINYQRININRPSSVQQSETGAPMFY